MLANKRYVGYVYWPIAVMTQEKLWKFSLLDKIVTDFLFNRMKLNAWMTFNQTCQCHYSSSPYIQSIRMKLLLALIKFRFNWRVVWGLKFELRSPDSSSALIGARPLPHSGFEYDVELVIHVALSIGIAYDGGLHTCTVYRPTGYSILCLNNNGLGPKLKTSSHLNNW